GGEDVHTAPIVGEGRTGVRRGGRADRQGRRSTGRRVVTGVGIAVPCGDSVGHACIDRVVDGVVQRAGGASTQAHIGDGRVLVVVGHPVDAGNNAGGGAGATAV